MITSFHRKAVSVFGGDQIVLADPPRPEPAPSAPDGPDADVMNNSNIRRDIQGMFGKTARRRLTVKDLIGR